MIRNFDLQRNKSRRSELNDLGLWYPYLCRSVQSDPNE